MTVLRVMPDRIDEATGGVYSLPSWIKNRFSPAPSLTNPAVFKASPSVNPSRRASSVTSALDK